MRADFGRLKLWVVWFVAFFVALKVVPQICAAPSNDSLAQTLRVDLGDGVVMDFVLIPAGSFKMGANEDSGDGDEWPIHNVVLTEPFYLGKFEVTQAQWEKIMATNPSRFKGPACPVESVSWNDAQTFLAKLSEKTSRRFTLPTEAQWEYACRAGTDSPWSFGSREEVAGDYAWLADNAAGETHPVGEKKPNPWGLYDMYGNAQEWCADWYGKHAYPNHDDKNPRGPEKGESRILRGGAWGDQPDHARSSARNCNGPEGANHGIGFRCAFVIESAPLETHAP